MHRVVEMRFDPIDGGIIYVAYGHGNYAVFFAPGNQVQVQITADVLRG